MKFMGSQIEAISAEDGLGAVILSLVGTVALGALLLAAGHEPNLALVAFPPMLAGALAHAAGIRVDRNPRAVLALSFVTFYLNQTALSLASMG